MKTSATPTEFESLMASVDPLDPERRAAVARLVFEVVATCPYCGETVRRGDPRRLVGGWLVHVICASDAASGGGRDGGQGGGRRG